MITNRENYDEVRQVTMGYVKEQLDKYLADGNYGYGTTDDIRMHVTDIGISILETRWPQI